MPRFNKDDNIVDFPARLAFDKVSHPAKDDGVDPATLEQLATFARFLFRSRQKRIGDLPGLEFGEPVWDMAIELFIRKSEGRLVTISNLCMAAGVPQTTALRWIDAMVATGHFIRRQDTDDRRRTFVHMSPDLERAVLRHLAVVREDAIRALR